MANLNSNEAMGVHAGISVAQVREGRLRGLFGRPSTRCQWTKVAANQLNSRIGQCFEGRRVPRRIQLAGGLRITHASFDRTFETGERFTQLRADIRIGPRFGRRRADEIAATRRGRSRNKSRARCRRSDAALQRASDHDPAALDRRVRSGGVPIQRLVSRDDPELEQLWRRRLETMAGDPCLLSAHADTAECRTRVWRRTDIV